MRNWQEDMELCEKATSGRWERVAANSEGPYLIRMQYRGEKTFYGVRNIFRGEDAQLIAEAREALPYWLTAYRELEAEAAVMREALGRMVLSKSDEDIPDDKEDAYILGYSDALVDIKQSLSSTAGQALLDRLAKAEYKLADHGPDGHNYTNAQYVELRDRMAKAEAVVEAAYDIDTERLKEINRAEQEGRLVIPPCKVGDTVFAANPFSHKIEEHTVLAIKIDEKGCLLYAGNAYKSAERVHLTREEAEQALADMERGGV